MDWKQVYVSEQEFRSFVEHHQPIEVDGVHGNEGVEVHCPTLGKMVNAVYDASIGAIRHMNANNPVFSSMPNRDILLYNDFLLNPDINTIVVDGFFGTGKTSTLSSHLVTGLLGKTISSAFISKPHTPLGKTNGHLPGDIYDKTVLEFQSFTQYFDRFGHPLLAQKLMGRVPDGVTGKPIEPILHLLVFEYLRGLDIDEGWVVLDEAQNTTVGEMASFISRVGDKAKLIIIGDSTYTQIDRRENTEENNGLVFAKRLFAGKSYAGIVELRTVKHILRGNRVRDLLLALKGR